MGSRVLPGACSSLGFPWGHSLLQHAVLYGLQVDICSALEKDTAIHRLTEMLLRGDRLGAGFSPSARTGQLWFCLCEFLNTPGRVMLHLTKVCVCTTTLGRSFTNAQHEHPKLHLWPLPLFYHLDLPSRAWLCYLGTCHPNYIRCPFRSCFSRLIPSIALH